MDILRPQYISCSDYLISSVSMTNFIEVDSGIELDLRQEWKAQKAQKIKVDINVLHIIFVLDISISKKYIVFTIFQICVNI